MINTEKRWMYTINITWPESAEKELDKNQLTFRSCSDNTWSTSSFRSFDTQLKLPLSCTQLNPASANAHLHVSLICCRVSAVRLHFLVHRDGYNCLSESLLPARGQTSPYKTLPVFVLSFHLCSLSQTPEFVHLFIWTSALLVVMIWIGVLSLMH